MKLPHWLIAAGITLAVMGGIFWSGWTIRGWQDVAEISDLPKTPQTKPLVPDTIWRDSTVYDSIPYPDTIWAKPETIKVAVQGKGFKPLVFAHRFPHQSDTVIVDTANMTVQLIPFDFFFVPDAPNSKIGLFGRHTPLLVIQGTVWTDGRLSASASVPLKGVWRAVGAIDDRGGKGFGVGVAF